MHRYCAHSYIRIAPAQVKPSISPKLVDQIDVRVGTILSVTDVPNSEKLVALKASFGDHRRAVLAGMRRERANPREIEGKQALFVVNLAPRKMPGMIPVRNALRHRLLGWDYSCAGNA
jgi:tRNA-binding protein